MKKAHKQETATFDELTFADQAKSINAQVAILKKAIKANIKRAKTEGRDIEKLKTKRYEQIIRLSESLRPKK